MHTRDQVEYQICLVITIQLFYCVGTENKCPVFTGYRGRASEVPVEALSVWKRRMGNCECDRVYRKHPYPSLL